MGLEAKPAALLSGSQEEGGEISLGEVPRSGITASKGVPRVKAADNSCPTFRKGPPLLGAAHPSAVPSSLAVGDPWALL